MQTFGVCLIALCPKSLRMHLEIVIKPNNCWHLSLGKENNNKVKLKCLFPSFSLFTLFTWLVIHRASQAGVN